jgi:hypothetical protein
MLLKIISNSLLEVIKSTYLRSDNLVKPYLTFKLKLKAWLMGQFISDIALIPFNFIHKYEKLRNASNNL